jgi:hypothetical protein
MWWKKMTFSAGLGILWGILICGGVPESNAQTDQVLDLSKSGLRDLIKASGFITAKPIPSWGSIIGSKDSAVNLTEGEVVYVRLESGKEVQPGDRFSIVRQGEDVAHPVTKKNLGKLVLVPGELTILGGKGQVVTAKINKSFRSVQEGDMIIPPQPAPPQIVPIRDQKKIKGIVLLSPEGEENITEKEVIFLDRGNRDGVIVGDLFSIYQEGSASVYEDFQKGEKPKLPLIKVGKAVVVSVQEETSTALVTHSSQAIYVGDQAVSGKE